jgi:hypothetical protein
VDEAAIRADLLAVKATGANLVRTTPSPRASRDRRRFGLLYMEEVR